MQSTKFKFIYLPVGLTLMLTGCGADDHSPTVDILGSYFPAWIICIVLGLALTLITRQVLIGFKVNTHLYPAFLVYLCMLVFFTMVLWLAFFQN
ncbi:MAG TPA: YtcA family lipoprotein [Candidatus Acidoferrum sp.]|nr:YtcA family lipoprotein [Candidatus Acidoferrum sp.]